MSRLRPGTELDGFTVCELLHTGGMADLFRVTYASGRAEPFPMVMKVPRMGGGEGAENIVSFEVEHQLLQAVHGVHVPRFVAAGDLARQPYLVMEYVHGRTLQAVLDDAFASKQRPDADTIARIGRLLAHAAHALHKQDAVHLDLKPANVVLRENGGAVLLDFGLSWHAHYPDLLAYAESNEVSLIVLGAATHGLSIQRLKPTVPTRVANEAPCSVLLVKQSTPYAHLEAAGTDA